MKLPTFRRNVAFSRLDKPSPALALADEGYGDLATGLMRASSTLEVEQERQRKDQAITDRKHQAALAADAKARAALRMAAYKNRVETQKNEYEEAGWNLDDQVSKVNIEFTSLLDPKGNVRIDALPTDMQFPGRTSAEAKTAISIEGLEMVVDGVVSGFEVEPYYKFQMAQRSIKAGASTISNDRLRDKFIKSRMVVARNDFSKGVESAVIKSRAMRDTNARTRIAGYKSTGDWSRMKAAAIQSNLESAEKKAAILEAEQNLEEDTYENILATTDLSNESSVAALRAARQTLAMDYESEYIPSGGKMDATTKLNLLNKMDTLIQTKAKELIDEQKLAHMRVMKDGTWLAQNILKSNIGVGTIRDTLEKLAADGSPEAISKREDIQLLILHKPTIQNHRLVSLPKREDQLRLLGEQELTIEDGKLYKILNASYEKDQAAWNNNSMDAAMDMNIVPKEISDITKDSILDTPTTSYLTNLYANAVTIANDGGINNSLLPAATAKQIVSSWNQLSLEQKGEFSRTVKSIYSDDSEQFFEKLNKHGMTSFERSLGKLFTNVSSTIAEQVAIGHRGRAADKGWDNTLQDILNVDYREITKDLMWVEDSDRRRNMFIAFQDMLYTLSNGDPEQAQDLAEEAAQKVFGGIGSYKGNKFELPNDQVTEDTFIRDFQDTHWEDFTQKGYDPIDPQFSARKVYKALWEGDYKFHKAGPNSYYITNSLDQKIQTKTAKGFRDYVWSYSNRYSRAQKKEDEVYKTGKQNRIPSLGEVSPMMQEALRKNISEQQEILTAVENIGF